MHVFFAKAIATNRESIPRDLRKCSIPHPRSQVKSNTVSKAISTYEAGGCFPASASTSRTDSCSVLIKLVALLCKSISYGRRAVCSCTYTSNASHSAYLFLPLLRLLLLLLLLQKLTIPLLLLTMPTPCMHPSCRRPKVAADGTCRVGRVSQATPPGCRRLPPPAESMRQHFCSPEHRRGYKLDSHSDVYSLGVLMLEFWCNYLLSRGLGNFGSVGEGRIVDLFRSGGAGTAVQPKAASGLLNAALVSRMLADDSLDRPDCFEILDELSES